MGILILIQESLSRACTRHVTPPLVTKAVEGIETTHDLQQVSNSKSWLSMHYFKIPYVGHFSGVAQQRERKLINRFCKLIEIKFVCSTFKIKNFFNVKDPFPDRLRVRIVYQFSCASYNACYVGETSRYFAKRVREHLSSDRSSHVYKHLQALESDCRTSCNLDCFKILDSTPS